VLPAPRGVKGMGTPMSQNQRDYEVGRGKPPVHSRFTKGQSGNPRGPRPKNLPALLVEALDEPVAVTIEEIPPARQSSPPRKRGPRACPWLEQA